MWTQTLAPEIIDHVFSFLQSDPTTLAICSRAHSTLSPIAERLLYADIVVLNDSFEDDDRFKLDSRLTFEAAKLHELLINSPHIAKYVRKLEICLSSYRAPGIAPILPMLMRLDGIFLTSTFYDYWSSLSKKFRDAFKERIKSSLSVLTEVSIHFYSFPVHIFDSCKTVKRIGLHRWINPENGLNLQPHVLDSLSLYSWQPFLERAEFMDWAREHIHSLKFLLFHSSNGGSINIVLPELLGICSNSLRGLEVNLSDGSRGGPILVDLSSVPHLKDLTIRSNLHRKYLSRDGSYECAFLAIIQLLETAPRLDNLILKINNDAFSKEIVFKYVDWSPLITTLSRLSGKFRHIEIQLGYVIYEFGPFVPSMDTVPRLYGSEIVSDLIAKGILNICATKFKLYF